MSDDAKEKLFREFLYIGFTLYSVVELIRGVRDAWVTGSKVFASVPNDVLAAYPQLNDMVREGVIPFLQKDLKPHEFEQLTQFMTTYHQQILIFTPLAAAILVGLGVFLYQLTLTLTFYFMGHSALEKSIEGFLLASAFALAMLWPSVLIVALVICAVSYFVFASVPLTRGQGVRT